MNGWGGWDAVARQHGTDKASNGHDYMRHYETVLATRAISRIAEIGVASGASLRMWAALFPGAKVVGVDINPDCAQHAGGLIEVLIGDAGSRTEMRSLGRRHFDLIVDDGSHDIVDTQRTLDVFVPHLAEDGLYVIEDVCVDQGVRHVHHLDAVLVLLEEHDLAPLAVEQSASGAAQVGDLVIVFAERE